MGRHAARVRAGRRGREDGGLRRRRPAGRRGRAWRARDRHVPTASTPPTATCSACRCGTPACPTSSSSSSTWSPSPAWSSASTRERGYSGLLQRQEGRGGLHERRLRRRAAARRSAPTSSARSSTTGCAGPGSTTSPASSSGPTSRPPTPTTGRRAAHAAARDAGEDVLTPARGGRGSPCSKVAVLHVDCEQSHHAATARRSPRNRPGRTPGPGPQTRNRYAVLPGATSWIFSGLAFIRAHSGS